MKPLLVIILVVFLVTSTSFGCNKNEANKANILVERAQDSVKEEEQRDIEMDEEIEKIDHLLDADPPNAEKIIISATKTAQSLNLQAKSIKETADLFEQARRYNLTDPYKDYLDMEIDASKTSRIVTLHMKAINDGFVNISRRILEGKTTNKELVRFDRSNGDLIDEMEAIDQDYLEQRNAARRFFIKNNLGR